MDSTWYQVELEFTERVLGTVPANKEIYSSYIASKAADLGLAEEEVETVQTLEDKGHTGFHKDDKGCFIYNYMMKGFLCESARTNKTFGVLKQLQDKFKRHVFVQPRRIRLPEPSGVLERPLRAQTALGPRVCLARSDYLAEGTKIKFEVEILDVAGITKGCLEQVLDYGSRIGLGQWRSGGFGTFLVLKLEEK
jgi:hypothetical protein